MSVLYGTGGEKMTDFDLMLKLFLAAVFIIIDGASKYFVSHHLLGMTFASPVYTYGGIGVFQGFLGKSGRFAHSYISLSGSGFDYDNRC